MSKKINIEKVISLITALLVVFIIILTFNSAGNTISSQQDSQIEQLTKIITYEVNRLVEVNTLVESYQTQNLETISNDLLEHFGNRNFSDIKIDELKQLANQYKLSGLALFKDEKSDIVIEKSTSEVEIGLSTKNWGFWYNAFRQLFDKEKVTIDKGTSTDGFWVGPRSKAYEQNGFFLFSYIKVPDQPYLLNIFIDDKNAYDATSTVDTNEVFETLVNNSEFIDQIAIINVDAWNNRFQHENRSKLQDYTIEYGRYSSFSAEDTYYLNQTVNLDIYKFLNLNFKIDNKNKVKRYVKLTDNEVLIFVLNRDTQNALYFQIGATVTSGLMSIWFLAYMHARYNTTRLRKLIEIEKERLKIADSYRHMVQLLPSIVLRLNVIDKKIIIRHCEGKAMNFIGLDSNSIKNKQLDQCLPNDYIDIVKAQLNKMTAGESCRFEYKIANRIFENKLEWLVNPLDNQLNEYINDDIIIMWNDITELRQSEDKAKFMAYHDYLSKLPNRRSFKEMTERYLDNSNNPLYLAFIDLDGFKIINDNYGHDIGDELLVQVARRFNSSITSDDFVARMGGDEFAILFRNIKSKENFDIKINKIKNEVCKKYTIENHTFTIGLSIGISVFPTDGDNYVSLLKKADIAMYKVKYAGKNNHIYYDSNMKL